MGDASSRALMSASVASSTVSVSRSSSAVDWVSSVDPTPLAVPPRAAPAAASALRNATWRGCTSLRGAPVVGPRTGDAWGSSAAPASPAPTSSSVRSMRLRVS